VRILDCTLRDGSYAINFQFTAADTARIAGALDRAGFPLIEVGHGVGLNASNAGFGEAAETDEGYLEAAASAVTRGQFGMFCIPGVARVADLDTAARFGMGFVRIGANAGDIEQTAPFFDRARHHGMFVCANLMKSYALAPAEFGLVARRAERLGAQTLYIVDSAGGMLPGDLEQYIRAVQDSCDLPVAFHGHDNLGLAVSNTLRAIELGAEIVDSSLQGLGRSAGNTPTELLLAALGRLGHDTGIDLLTVLDIGHEYVRPLIHRTGLGQLDVVCGVAQFHSSYLGVIRKVSSKYQIDPRRLIMEVTKSDKVDAPLELVEQCARRIRETTEVVTARFDFDLYFGDEQTRRPK
jgi:4-hydroxy-2-oxovalerate aldolase